MKQNCFLLPRSLFTIVRTLLSICDVMGVIKLKLCAWASTPAQVSLWKLLDEVNLLMLKTSVFEDFEKKIS